MEEEVNPNLVVEVAPVEAVPDDIKDSEAVGAWFLFLF